MNHPNPNPPPAPKKWRWLLVAATLLLGAGLLTSLYYLRQPTPLLTPLGQEVPLTSPPINLQKVVLGFVPYWLIADATAKKELTHLAYFGIEFDKEGNLLTRYPDGAPELGYSRLTDPPTQLLLAEQKKLGGHTLLTLKVLEKDAIASLVSNQTYRNNAINHTLEIAGRYDFDGIVIDLEYADTPTSELKANFTTFVSQLTTTLRREYPHAYTAIAVFADSAAKDRIWQLPALHRFVDHIIVMTYDFHRPSSPQAGPVAPLYGGCPTCHYTYDVTQAVSDFSLQIPPEKLLLGIPFYGYQWRVTSENPFANTYPSSGALASIGRVTNLLEDPKETLITKEGWDEQALAPYLIVEEEGTTHVIWYENDLSLGYKFDLVNTAGLGGIAIWAVGYEGENTQPWDLIGQKFAL